MREQALLYRWRKGHESAGVELAAHHVGSVHRYLGHIAGEAHAAQLTTEVLRRGLKAARWSDGEQSFRNILLLVSEDVVREHVRQRAATREIKLRARVHEVRDPVGREALSILPLELQIVFELCLDHHLDPREAAELLDQSHGTIKRKLAQANKLLAKIRDELRTRMPVTRSERAPTAPFNRVPARAMPVPPPTASAVLNQVHARR